MEHLRSSRVSPKSKDVIRLQGLRILTRMIVQAHLRSLVERDAV